MVTEKGLTDEAEQLLQEISNKSMEMAEDNWDIEYLPSYLVNSYNRRINLVLSNDLDSQDNEAKAEQLKGELFEKLKYLSDDGNQGAKKAMDSALLSENSVASYQEDGMSGLLFSVCPPLTGPSYEDDIGSDFGASIEGITEECIDCSANYLFTESIIDPVQQGCPPTTTPTTTNTTTTDSTTTDTTSTSTTDSTTTSSFSTSTTDTTSTSTTSTSTTTSSSTTSSSFSTSSSDSTSTTGSTSSTDSTSTTNSTSSTDSTSTTNTTSSSQTTTQPTTDTTTPSTTQTTTSPTTSQTTTSPTTSQTTTAPTTSQTTTSPTTSQTTTSPTTSQTTTSPTTSQTTTSPTTSQTTSSESTSSTSTTSTSTTDTITTSQTTTSPTTSQTTTTVTTTTSTSTTSTLPITVEITEPDGSPSTDNHFAFGSAAAPSGACYVGDGVWSLAGVANGGDSSKLSWSLNSISGSSQSSVPNPAKGSLVQFIYTGLPSSNSQFGNKTLRLTHPDTFSQDSATVQIFFHRDAYNHPGTGSNSTRNWYYYWRNDSVVSDLSYFSYDDSSGYGYYVPSTGKLAVCNAAPTSDVCTETLYNAYYNTHLTTGLNGIAQTTAVEDDVQVIPVGNGQPSQTCITAGSNGTLDTSPSGDDTIVGVTITTGSDGVCNTTASGDDVQVITVNQGKPSTTMITAGADTFMHTSPNGDDVWSLANAQSVLYSVNYSGIDICAATCTHELKHRSNDQLSGADSDDDGIPDSYEGGTYHLDPSRCDTYDIQQVFGYAYSYGDDEFTARLSEHNPGSRSSSKDWSDTNGKQWSN